MTIEIKDMDDDLDRFAKSLKPGDKLDLYFNKKNINNRVWEFRGRVDDQIVLRTPSKREGWDFAYTMEDVLWLWVNRDRITLEPAK